MEMTVQLGQLAIMLVVTIIGFFVKKEIHTFAKRLDAHDILLMQLVKDVSFVVGILEAKKSK